MNIVKKIIIIAILAIIAATAVFVALSTVKSNNDPKVQLALAYKLLDEGNYEEAIVVFNKVIKIDEKNIEARIGLSKVYVKQEKYDKAEEILKEALGYDNKNETVYDELIGVYKLCNEYEKLNRLINDLEGIGLGNEADKIRPKAPTANFESGEYSQPIGVVLSGTDDVYYTTDGSEPSINSLKYENEIRLNDENTYHIKAMAVDNKGICSKISEYQYSISFAEIKAPVSNLKAGAYVTTQKFKISNPNSDGTIYYSMDEKIPHIKYTGEIQIDSSVTVKAMVKNETTGKTSSVASWKYVINKQAPAAPATQSTQPPAPAAEKKTDSPFVGVTVQNGTGYTMKRFFTDLFGFEVESSYMRGVGIAVDESAWNKEVSQNEWNTWMQWRKEKYGY